MKAENTILEISIFQKLQQIQSDLKAPKGQMNKFGGYKYRSCEDILESLKPHLKAHQLTLLLDDDMTIMIDRVYVKATAILTDGVQEIKVNGFAREELTKKGMDGSQITGTASSYARKYALNGMFLIDDTKDSDHTNDGSRAPESTPAPAPSPTPARSITGEQFKKAMASDLAGAIATLKAIASGKLLATNDQICELEAKFLTFKIQTNNQHKTTI